MWRIDGAPDCSWVTLCPSRVLYDFDGPRIFVCYHIGNSYLAYQCAEEPDLMRFLVVPFDSDSEMKLVTGDMTLREALTASSFGWVADVDFGWKLIGCWRVCPSDLPDENIAKEGVLLWPHLTRQARAGMYRSATRGDTSTPVGKFDSKCKLGVG